MHFIHSIFLSILQGFTEFLPVSSSAHLILVPKLLSWPDQGLSFDIAVHFGTLLAVVTFYRHLILKIIRATFKGIVYQEPSSEFNTFIHLSVASIPVGLMGLILHDTVSMYARNVKVIAASTIGFGLLLGGAELIRRRKLHTQKGMKMTDAVIIGLSQVCAIIPGASRSGVTLSSGLLLGLNPVKATEFSFLLSIPVILAATSLEIFHILKGDGLLLNRMIVVSVITSYLTGLLCIHYFLKIILKIGLMPFVYYRIFLGVFILWQLK